MILNEDLKKVLPATRKCVFHYETMLGVGQRTGIVDAARFCPCADRRSGVKAHSFPERVLGSFSSG
jgi:hypothetical protein